MSFIGWNIGECWFMCVSIGSQRCRVNGFARPSSIAISDLTARFPVSPMSMCG